MRAFCGSDPVRHGGDARRAIAGLRAHRALARAHTRAFHRRRGRAHVRRGDNRHRTPQPALRARVQRCNPHLSSMTTFLWQYASGTWERSMMARQLNEGPLFFRHLVF